MLHIVSTNTSLDATAELHMADYMAERHMRGYASWGRVLWFVPSKLRAKADQRWRYGCFLGRSMGSDQNVIGLSTGEVIRARAMVRLTPEARWDARRLLAVKTTPLTEHTRWMDKIEEHEHTNKHEPRDEGGDGSPIPRRRVRITLKDLKDSRTGVSPLCPRCNCHRNEACTIPPSHRAL